MSTHEITQLIDGLVDLLKLLLGVQIIIFIAWLAQFISNLTIITQLPKIKRHLASIDEELYSLTNIEEIGKVQEITENKKNEEILDSLEDYEKSNIKLDKEAIEYIILGILIMIITILIIVKFK